MCGDFYVTCTVHVESYRSIVPSPGCGVLSVDESPVCVWWEGHVVSVTIDERLAVGTACVSEVSE